MNGHARFRFLQSLALLIVMIISSPASATTIRLRPGFQQILNYSNVTRISVGNPEIIEARPLLKNEGILVVGKREGETDLVLWNTGRRIDLTIEVREKYPQLVEEARAFASSFPGIQVSEAEGAVLVSGSLQTRSDKKLFEEFASGRPNVHLRISLPEEKRILLSYDLKIVEISKGGGHEIGARWPESTTYKGSWVKESGARSAFTLSSDYEAGLKFLLANGRARILANPRLVCESGESASFLAGGEIPIVIVTPETRKVEWKTYGIALSLQPKMDTGDKVRTQITAEISTVDHGSGTSEVPGFLTRRVITSYSGKLGSTILLSGLLKNETAKDVSKFPLLGHIPILGELFKSRSFRENESELAIFVSATEAKSDYSEESSMWDRKGNAQRDSMRFRILD